MRMMDYFRKGVEHAPDRAAFVDDQAAYTYREIDAMAVKIAAALPPCRPDQGVRAAVYSPNDPRAFACIMGIFYAGGVWVPANARNTVASNAHFLSMTGCEILFYHSSFQAAVDDLAALVPTIKTFICIDAEGPDGVPSLEALMAGAERAFAEPVDDPDRIVTIFPTGGTTGLSKGAPWSQRTWEAMISAFWLAMPNEAPSVHLVAGPMTHAAGGLALMMVPKAATNVVLTKADPELIMQAIARHGVTHVYLPPTVLYMMLAHPKVREYDYSSLKYFVLAAAPIAPEKLKEALDVFGPVMCQSYGQAEAPMFMTFLSTADLTQAGSNVTAKRLASCGRATTNMRVEIMAEDGTLLPPGERGEIVTKGSLVFPGYYNNPEATEEVSRFGWHHTGDIGYRDEDGFLYIVDRKKDMIVTGGFNVFSVEIEQVLLSHPAVGECAVVGVPDEKWGEAVKAVIELRPGATVSEADLIALVKRELGGVHAPKSVEIWDELPRSGNGKVLKRDVRETFWKERERAV